jgi:hypothetical protein
MISAYYLYLPLTVKYNINTYKHSGYFYAYFAEIRNKKLGKIKMKLKINEITCSLVLAIALGVSAPVNAGLIFNLGTTGNTNADIGFQSAADFWSNIFNDNISINITTGFTALASGVLGQASSTTLDTTFGSAKNALIADKTSTDDDTMVAGLPSGSVYSRLINGTAQGAEDHLQSNISAMSLTNANAKAIGLLGANNANEDAAITFSNQFAWDFDRSDGIGFGQYDFVGVAIHEIGHAMGFVSGVDSLDLNVSNNPGVFQDSQFDIFTSMLDFTRCSASSENAGADMDWTAGTRAKNFAIDGNCSGNDLVTNAWSTGTNLGDGRQASHWKDNLGLGIFDPTAAPPGGLNVVSSLDIQALDVIGWDLANIIPIPEPRSISLFLLGGLFFLGLGAVKRRKV